MVVDDLDVLGACGRPPKAHPELVVHADAVLTCPVTFECFKPVTGRNSEIFDPTCDLQLPQFAPRYAFNLLKPFDPAASGKLFGIRILKRYDHQKILMPYVINVKRDGYGLPALTICR